MKPIVFVLQDFDEGGVQRVTLKIANQMAQDGKNVMLIILKGHGVLTKLLHPSVEKVFLHKSKVIFSLFSLLVLLTKIKRCNLVSAIVQVNILCAFANALTFFRHHHIITEHTHSSLATKNAVRKNLKVAYFLQSTVYPLASKIYCVSKGIRDDLIKRVPSLEPKVYQITNPVIDTDFYKRADEALPSDLCSFLEGKTVVLGVGRLVPMKDFALLIQSFACATKKVDNLILLIIGEGPEFNELIKLTHSLGISDSVHFLGHLDNPLPYFKIADVFALTSKYEGFGLVLVEALALSKAVVSVNCECGPAEILDRVGILVDSRDPVEIADCLIRSIEAPPSVKQMKIRAADFEAIEVVKLYYQGFE